MSATDDFLDGGVLEAILDYITAPFGGEIFALLVGGTVLAILWYGGEGDLATPTVVLFLAGGFLLSALPPQFADLGQSLMLIGLAGGLLAVARRYVLSPGV